MQVKEACGWPGKWTAEHSGVQRTDTSSASDPGGDTGFFSQHSARIRGSTGMDVHTAATVVLDSAGVHKAPLDAFGPLGQGLGALLVG